MKQLIEMQSNDEGLWFVATHATEAYLQNALRQLHDAGEKLTAERDALGAELESALKDRVALAMQVDALRAELAKMREQGPVAWLKPCAELEVCEPHEDCSFPVYAAPGAQP